MKLKSKSSDLSKLDKGASIMSTICFETKIIEINNRRIVLYPKEASLSLYSKENLLKIINAVRAGVNKLDEFPGHLRFLFSDDFDLSSSENQKILNPVQAYFADVEKKQPVLIVYEINYSQ